MGPLTAWHQATGSTPQRQQAAAPWLILMGWYLQRMNSCDSHAIQAIRCSVRPSLKLAYRTRGPPDCGLCQGSTRKLEQSVCLLLFTVYLTPYSSPACKTAFILLGIDHCVACVQLEGSLQEEADRADTRPALVLSSDSNDSPQVVAWTAGRSMNRRHILVSICLPRCVQ